MVSKQHPRTSTSPPATFYCVGSGRQGPLSWSALLARGRVPAAPRAVSFVPPAACFQARVERTGAGTAVPFHDGANGVAGEVPGEPGKKPEPPIYGVERGSSQSLARTESRALATIQRTYFQFRVCLDPPPTCGMPATTGSCSDAG